MNLDQPENIKKLELEVAQKEAELEHAKEDYVKKLNKSKDFIEALKQEFESSSYRTQQFINFCRVFKKDFTKILSVLGVEKIEIDTKAHFEISGFFTFNGQIWYFALGDVRWNTTFLIRTAESYQDYMGGSNDYLNTENRESFIVGLKRVIGYEK